MQICGTTSSEMKVSHELLYFTYIIDLIAACKRSTCSSNSVLSGRILRKVHVLLADSVLAVALSGQIYMQGTLQASQLQF
jgi:hypothetical protein